MEIREKSTNLSDNVVLTLLVRIKGVRESSLEAGIKPLEELWLSPPPLLREISMDSQLVWRLLTDWYPMPSLLTAEELLALVPHVKLLEGAECAELGLEANGDWFRSVFLLYRGLLPPLLSIPLPDGESRFPCWFIVAWGLEMTTEFFIFSAVVMGTCLLGLPPKSLYKRQHEKIHKMEYEMQEYFTSRPYIFLASQKQD